MLLPFKHSGSLIVCQGDCQWIAWPLGICRLTRQMTLPVGGTLLGGTLLVKGGGGLAD